MTRRIGELLAAGAGDRTDAEVRAFVETGIAAAIGHGIRSYPLLERYLELTAHCGEPLEDAPWAGPILADPFLAAGDKLAALEKLSRGPAR